LPNTYHSLKRIHYDHGEMEEIASEAKSIVNNIEQQQEFDIEHDPKINIPDKYKQFIWFALPKDIISMKTNCLVTADNL